MKSVLKPTAPEFTTLTCSIWSDSSSTIRSDEIVPIIFPYVHAYLFHLYLSYKNYRTMVLPYLGRKSAKQAIISTLWHHRPLGGSEFVTGIVTTGYFTSRLTKLNLIWPDVRCFGDHLRIWACIWSGDLFIQPTTTMALKNTCSQWCTVRITIRMTSSQVSCFLQYFSGHILLAGVGGRLSPTPPHRFVHLLFWRTSV